MSKPVLKGPQLCLITDITLPDLLPRVEQALAAGVTMLQLRGHTLAATDLYALAQRLQPLCRAYGALFLVNDRLDVGLAVGADGFQLGKRSLSPVVARRVVGEHVLLGASVHTLQEARSALEAGADFLLAGTIFASPSHPGEPGAGPELVRAIKHAFPHCFMLAIGGMTRETVGQAMAAGADGVAVISAILRADNVKEAVKEICGKIKSSEP